MADDLATARSCATDPASPYRFYYHHLPTKMLRHIRLNLFRPDPNMPDSDLTLDMVCDRVVIWGTPDKVADKIPAVRDTVGVFAKLLHAGKDWADPALGRRPMTLLAEQVLPRVNAVLTTAAAAE